MKYYLFVIIVLSYFTRLYSDNYVKYVDPFIGTAFHGHTFPGATMPNGMVQLSPDNHLLGWDASSGYHYSDSIIYSFSHTHLSGTGNGDLCDISLLPFTQTGIDRPFGLMDKKTEMASPGYYSVYLKNYDVKVELTATNRTGFHKYTYNNGDERNVLLDLGFVIQPDWGHKLVGNNYCKVSDSSISGYFETTGWAKNNKVYYFIEFSEKILKEKIVAIGNDKKIFLGFGKNKSPLYVKVGISYVDISGAIKNIKDENPGWDFYGIRNKAEDEWNRLLSVVKIKTKDIEIKKNFYTALYHCLISPNVCQDVDGRYLGMDHSVHKSTDEYVAFTNFSLWDTFRALHPLLTILYPEKAKKMGETLVKAYREGGMIPRWALVCNYTGIMVGYPGVSVLADLIAKDLYNHESIDEWCEAAVHSSKYLPEGPITSPHQYYKDKYGFLPGDSIWYSVSWGVECAYYDWAISKILEKSGRNDVAMSFREKSKAYLYYLDKDLVKMRPIDRNANFIEPYDPRQNSGYQEGNGFQWSLFVPHDMEGFISSIGGIEKLEQTLDTLFNTSSHGKHGADVTGLIGQYAHGNEPSHHIAYLYNWTANPWKCQYYLDRIMNDFYKPTPEGIIGNEDCGQMSAWYVLSALGFYQVCPGIPEYAIGRPLIDGAEIQLEKNKFNIIVHNNSKKNKFIHKIKLNGKDCNSFFFSHECIKSGGKLEIFMSDKY